MAVRCPICEKLAQEAIKPFCSKRCADIDLARWFGESYKVATSEAPEGKENPSEAPESEE